MASTILRTPPSFILNSSGLGINTSSQKPTIALLKFPIRNNTKLTTSSSHLKLSPPLYVKPRRFPAFVAFAGEADEVEESATAATATAQEELDDETAGENAVNEGVIIDTEEKEASGLMASLQSYKEALENDDESKISEIEAFLQTIEDEKNSLAITVAALSAELSSERERVLRISADFDNFRKRTERERLSLMTNVQGEVVESLLPVLDNFERAKTQIKVETEGEEKINNSYQSIYKQFMETLTSLGVETVETVGRAFDPLLHEAIMREDSTEFEEGIILQEFRKGFKLGERLLRPAMVKVSAGPGPAKTEGDAAAVTPGDDEESEETIQESIEDGDPA